MSPCRCLSYALMLVLPATAGACVEGAPRGDIVTLEKAADSTQPGERPSMQIVGAGWFRSLTIEKDGGTSDDTTVTLELDGEPMISTSFAILKNAWNQIGTSSLVATVRTDGDRQVMTIWYSPELMFRAFANVRVEVNEAGVGGVRIRSIMNKPGPHDKHLTGTAVALPAFK
ncbi:MAG: hypothetical protein U1F52_17920 [Burkholderiales bacterium]